MSANITIVGATGNYDSVSNTTDVLVLFQNPTYGWGRFIIFDNGNSNNIGSSTPVCYNATKYSLSDIIVLRFSGQSSNNKADVSPQICVSGENCTVHPPTCVPTNLLLNPGFETVSPTNPNMPANWSTYYVGTQANPFSYPEPGRNGGSSVAVNLTTADTKEADWSQPVSGINHTNTYKLSGWMKTQNITGETTMHVDWYTSNGTYISTSTMGSQLTVGWEYLEMYIPNVPINAVNAKVVLKVVNSSGKVWYDDISFIANENSVSGTPTNGIVISKLDSTPPADVTNISVTPGDGQLSFSWNIVTSNVFCYQVILKDSSGTTVASGYLLPNKTGATFTGLTNGTTYTLSIFSESASEILSSGVSTSGTPAIPSTLTTISLSPTSATVAINGTQQFSATCKDQNSNSMTCPTLTWDTTDHAVGTVNSSGLFTAGSTQGTVTVKATGGTIVGSSVVTITTTSPAPVPITTPTNECLYINVAASSAVIAAILNLLLTKIKQLIR